MITKAVSVGTLRAMPRPATGKTKIRNVRVGEPLWSEAIAIARRRGETVTDVIVKALTAYVRRHRSDPTNTSGEE